MVTEEAEGNAPDEQKNIAREPSVGKDEPQSDAPVSGKPVADTGPGEETGARTKGRKTLSGAALRRFIGPVIIGILVVGVIALFAHTRSQSQKLDEEIEKRRTIEGQVTDLEQSLTGKIRELNDTGNKLATAQTDRDQLQEKVTTLTSGHTQLKTRLESARSYTITLEERLKAEQETIAELQASVKEDRQTQKRLFAKIESLLEDKKTLQDKLFQSQSRTAGDGAVDMPGLVVKDSRSAIPSLRGTILKVNQKYAFVVFNRGESDGVKAGDRFRVMDRNKEIGEVIAKRVLPDMTVADINPRKTHRQLKKGFSVFPNE